MTHEHIARGKMRVRHVDVRHDSDVVYMDCEYDPKNPADRAFAEATPSGTMALQISNPELRGKFKARQSYYIDIIPIDAEAK